MWDGCYFTNGVSLPICVVLLRVHITRTFLVPDKIRIFGGERRQRSGYPPKAWGYSVSAIF